MQVSDVFRFRNPEIKALHLTWVAFFMTFYVWFNLAPLATSMMRSENWLTQEDIRLLLIANVALTIPARVFIGMALDRYGPRRVFSVLMVLMAFPTFVFAFGNSYDVLLASRLVLSCIGASFVVGIHMTALWFQPRSIGLAEGVYAGWGNSGSAVAAITLPTIALHFFGGEDGWRWAIALSGLVMLVYGVYYWFAITDGPSPDTLKKPRKTSAIEVSSWGDLVLLCLSIIPMVGALALLVYPTHVRGLINDETAMWLYIIIAAVVIYQLYKAIRLNVPILKRGVPKDDRYPFKSVVALNITYIANFGAGLAVVSMLPMFFEKTWGLNPVIAGIIAACFATMDVFARPMGGLVSDRFGNRRFVMLAYMVGISIGFFLMGMMDASWPLYLAIAATMFASFFLQGAEGATCGILPSIKRRLTGQLSGMVGAYGNVGAVIYLFIFMFVTPQQFFYIVAVGALLSWVVCWFWLEEPEGGFADEYALSSVDRAIANEAQQKKEAQADLARLFPGKIELAERGDGFQLTTRFASLNELRDAVARLGSREPTSEAASPLHPQT